MSFFSLISTATNQIASGIPFWKLSAPTHFYADKTGVQLLREQIFSNQEVMKLFYKVPLTNDPFERIGLILKAVLNPHISWDFSLALPSVQGEFLEHTANIIDDDGKILKCRVVIEKVCCEPPVIGYRITGPNFEIETKNGIYGDRRNMRFGIHSVDMNFDHIVIKMTTELGEFEWCQPSNRFQGIVIGNKQCGIHGDFWITDPSGCKFVGKVTLSNNVTGKLFNGKSFIDIEGNLLKGLKFRPRGSTWTTPLKLKPISILTSKDTRQDSKYVDNIWQNVFHHMRKDPPDFASAEVERIKVTKADRGEPNSRFGLRFDPHR
jgi:hypothetical protein